MAKTNGQLGVGACLKDCNNATNWAVATETQEFNENIAPKDLKAKLPTKKTQAINQLRGDLVNSNTQELQSGGKRRRTRKSNKKKKIKKK